MAETSGFFQATWDSSLTDPTTGEDTGWWDRSYIASQFSRYFALFIGNGVFGSPTNQLKVSPGTGLSINISEGWAFINGNWYHNDSTKNLVIVSNTTGSQRTDSVKVRLDEQNRRILADIYTGDTSVIRGGSIYDLKLANVIVPPNATSISAANITDTRTDEAVCGLVKSLMEVETTADLFAQYQAQFDEWFDDIKDQLTGDLAVRLQLEFNELNDNVEDYKTAMDEKVEGYNEEAQQAQSSYESTMNQRYSSFTSSINQTISNYQSNIQSQISGYNTNYSNTLSQTRQAAQTAQQQVTDYVDKDYVIAEQAFTFSNKVCTINDSKVTANSLIDVYFTAATIGVAAKAGIVVDSSAGKITLTADRQPTGIIRGIIRVRVRS